MRGLSSARSNNTSIRNEERGGGGRGRGRGRGREDAVKRKRRAANKMEEEGDDKPFGTEVEVVEA